MTTGYIVRDDRFLANADWGKCIQFGSDLKRVGTYFSKSWHGSDSGPSVPVQPRYEVFRYNVYNPKTGKDTVRTVRCRTPATAKVHRDEHPYYCEIIYTSDRLVYESYPGAGCSNGNTQYQFVSTESMGETVENYDNTWKPNDQLAIVNKLGDKISQQQFNMAVFLGEGRQSLQTIVQASTRLANSMKHLRKGNFRKAANELAGKKSSRTSKINKNASGIAVTDDWVSARWLELQYGWKPLLQDISSAAAHFASMQNRPQRLIYRKGSPKSEPRDVTSSQQYTRVGGTVEHRVSIKAIVSKIDEVALLGLTDPASLAWEKLPYSFVADWVIPIQDYLQAINLQRSLSAVYVTSHMFKKVVTFEEQIIPTGTMQTHVANFNHTQIIVERTVSSDLSIPLPQVKSWDKIATFTHTVNSLALLSRVFSARL